MSDFPERQLLPGKTAYELLVWRYRCTTAALVVLATTFVCSASGVPQSWFTTSLMVAIGLTLLPVVVLIGSVGKRERAEQRAGYTTQRFGNKKLEQRDPYLGRVIRHPSEPYLSRDEFLQIVKNAKTTAERLESRA